MCRIVGIWDKTTSLKGELEKVIVLVRDAMAYGGPDDAGIFVDNEKGIALAHRRLSIIDISSLGHQPMSNESKTIWITYNGEIYNFMELRDELINRGYKFKSKTDTEVLLYGYEEWGIEKLLSRLRGMFAFAIYDNRTNNTFKLILAKDRFGIKPLYYYMDKEKFIFASEVKAIMKSKLVPDKKNEEAMVRFLQLGSVPAPLTTIKDVFSLPSGHYMEVSDSGFAIKKYWSLLNSFKEGQNKHVSYKQALETTTKLFEEAVKIHLISDVPLGVFLSGGIDSSALVAVASKLKKDRLKTLSVVFSEDKYNESRYAKLVANKYNTDHREIMLSGKDFVDELPLIFNAMDEPSIDGVNTYFISKAAKNAGLTVVLSGIGGDEVFLGYDHFKNTKNIKNLSNLLKAIPQPLRKSILHMAGAMASGITGRSYEKLSYLESPNVKNSYLMFRGLFTKNQIQSLLDISKAELNRCGEVPEFTDELSGEDLMTNFDFMDFNHYLQNQILKDADFMSMRHAVEIRVPFLDHKLVEYVISLPLKYKLHNNINKPLLVNSLHGGLSPEIVNRKKMGFTFPFDIWIKENHQILMEQSLDKTSLNRKETEKIWKRFIAGELHWSRVWAVMVVEDSIKTR